MNIREVIPAVVEEVICGVEACQKQGLDVFPPEAIDFEMPVCGCAKVNVRIRLFAGMRMESDEFDRRGASKCVGGNTSRRSAFFEDRKAESGCNGFREAEPARQANRQGRRLAGLLLRQNIFLRTG
jgi:hypothetical protein